jgi:ATP phosphoribosyltransferase
MRMRAVDAARRFKYVMMNAPEDRLGEIRSILPGLKAPTVVKLDEPGWVAVHAAIEEDLFWDKIEQLRAAGASEILVSALDKLML